jgi:hypothetical protein
MEFYKALIVSSLFCFVNTQEPFKKHEVMYDVIQDLPTQPLKVKIIELIFFLLCLSSLLIKFSCLGILARI